MCNIFDKKKIQEVQLESLVAVAYESQYPL